MLVVHDNSNLQGVTKNGRRGAWKLYTKQNLVSYTKIL